jgi:hypothetical protein
MSWIRNTDLEPDPKHRVQERCGLVVEEEDLLDKLEDVDHPVCQQATDALLTAESEADQVWSHKPACAINNPPFSLLCHVPTWKR